MKRLSNIPQLTVIADLEKVCPSLLSKAFNSLRLLSRLIVMQGAKGRARRGHLNTNFFILKNIREPNRVLNVTWEASDMLQAKWVDRGKPLIQHQCKADQSHLLLKLKRPESKTNWELYCKYLFKTFFRPALWFDISKSAYN